MEKKQKIGLEVLRNFSLISAYPERLQDCNFWTKARIRNVDILEDVVNQLVLDIASVIERLTCDSITYVHANH